MEETDNSGFGTKRSRKGKDNTRLDESVDERNNLPVDQASDTNTCGRYPQQPNYPRSDDQDKDNPNIIERKRVREQKRRTDITNAIDLLVQVLLQIDAPNFQSIGNDHLIVPPSLFVGQAAKATPTLNVPNSGALGIRSLPYNRSEIISYAKDVLEKIHQENLLLRLEVETLKSRLSDQVNKNSAGTMSQSNKITTADIPPLDPSQRCIGNQQLLESFLTWLLVNDQNAASNISTVLQTKPSSNSSHPSQTDDSIYPSSIPHQPNSINTSLSRFIVPDCIDQINPTSSQLQTSAPSQSPPNNVTIDLNAALQPYVALLTSTFFQSLPMEQQISLCNQIILSHGEKNAQSVSHSSDGNGNAIDEKFKGGHS